MRSSLLLMACGLFFAACDFNPRGEGSNDGAVDAVEIDACVPATETCEGTDQDCDGMIDEGFVVNAPCDGPDMDVCQDDMTVCDATGQQVCGNTSGDDDAERCNAADDDCDGMMDEGFVIDVPCDGADDDECLEGTAACSPDGSAVVCDDDQDDDVELCNMADDDCDGMMDEGFMLASDPMNCGACGNVCVASMGTTSCMGGTCRPVCNAGAADCDGDPDNGCELTNTNPTCVAGQIDVSINGDVADTDMVTGTTEDLFHLRVRETQSPDIDITARIALTSGAGTDYDLFVYCPSCNAAPLNEADDTIEVGRNDVNMSDRSFSVWVEVRLDTSGGPQTTCAPWTVAITGNVATTNRCGDN